MTELRNCCPGSQLKIDRQSFKAKQYWSLTSRPHEDSFEDTAQTVRELVTDAMRRRTVGQDIAFLLSGGLDSSAICAIAAQEHGQQLRTISLDYADNDVHFRPGAFQPNTDAPWVRRVSDFLTSAHEEFVLDTPALASALFDAVRARDLPGMADIDASLLLFARHIRTVAPVGITGECADEFFGGYPWFYRRAEDADTFPWARKLDARVKLYSPELVAKIRPEEYLRARYEDALARLPALDGEAPQEASARKISWLTINHWMPTLLTRQDRMSARAGLILRAPFSDHRIAEYAWNIPWSMKYRHSREKGLLRHALTGLLPDDVLWRKKSPFPKTHNPDYIEVLRKATLRMLDNPGSLITPLLDKQAVKRFAESMTRDTDLPWFGQLMNAPQLLAYFLQTDFWLREYGVEIV